jgi:hypothetical protein
LYSGVTFCTVGFVSAKPVDVEAITKHATSEAIFILRM